MNIVVVLVRVESATSSLCVLVDVGLLDMWRRRRVFLHVTLLLFLCVLFMVVVSKLQ